MHCQDGGPWHLMRPAGTPLDAKVHPAQLLKPLPALQWRSFGHWTKGARVWKPKCYQSLPQALASEQLPTACSAAACNQAWRCPHKAKPVQGLGSDAGGSGHTVHIASLSQAMTKTSPIHNSFLNKAGVKDVHYLVAK